MTRIKAIPFSSRAEFETALDRIASNQNLLDALKARHDRRVIRLLTDYAEVSKPYRDEILLLTARAEKFADENRDALLPEKRKSNETALVTYGWRTGNHTLVTISKWTWEKVLAKLAELHLTDYIRDKPSVDKEGILAAAKEKGVLQIHDKDDHFDAVIDVPLAEVGLKIEQEETFFIEPKVEDPKRIKAPEAAA